MLKRLAKWWSTFKRRSSVILCTLKLRRCKLLNGPNSTARWQHGGRQMYRYSAWHNLRECTSALQSAFPAYMKIPRHCIGGNDLVHMDNSIGYRNEKIVSGEKQKAKQKSGQWWWMDFIRAQWFPMFVAADWMQTSNCIWWRVYIDSRKTYFLTCRGLDISGSY